MFRTSKGVLFVGVLMGALALGPAAAGGGVVANQPPRITPIDDVTIAEGQPLEITVQATDDPEQTLRYTAEGVPDGAVWNPDTHVFAWTPGVDQAGAYSVRFTVTDDSGAFAFDDVLMTVTDNAPIKAATTTRVHAKAGPARIKATGTVRPAQVGSRVKVTLLRKRGARWEPATSVRVDLSNGTDFRAKFKRPADGRCAVGASFRGDRDALPSSATSRAFAC